MNKQAKRVIANVVDFDMHNLFPPMTPMENMADAASGDFVAQPKRTLRERPYTSNPIKVMPKYEGDFLDKLRKQPLHGKPVMPLETVVQAGNPENLQDFKGPDDWLKHQEKPHPRNLTDDYYETNRPGEDAGQDTLDDLYDRGWDNEDAPEMSEDKVTRMFKSPIGIPIKVPFRNASQRVVNSFLAGDAPIVTGPSAGVVMSHYLLDSYPVELDLDLRSNKTAMLLKDLASNSSITTSKGTRKPGNAGSATIDKDGTINMSVPGVVVSAKAYNPKSARWTFTTHTSGKAPPKVTQEGWPYPYTTTFQFIPYKNVRKTSQLHVRVSCTCPSWVFWGAQYNAFMNDYLYGPIRPKFAPPKKRDKGGKFLVCKHVLACLPLVSKFFVGAVSDKTKVRLEKAPSVKIIPTIPEEVLRIPKELVDIEKRPAIMEIEKNWDLKPRSRGSWINKLQDPDELVYLTHRYPESSHLIAKRLKALAKIPKLEKEAEEALNEVEDIEKKVPKIILSPELQNLESNPDFIKSTAGWKDKDNKAKEDFFSNEKNVDIITLVGAQNRSDLFTIEEAVKRLKQIAENDEFLNNERKKAEERMKWFM